MDLSTLYGEIRLSIFICTLILNTVASVTMIMYSKVQKALQMRALRVSMRYVRSRSPLCFCLVSFVTPLGTALLMSAVVHSTVLFTPPPPVVYGIYKSYFSSLWVSRNHIDMRLKFSFVF